MEELEKFNDPSSVKLSFENSAPAQEKSSNSLYDISETENGFSVTLPGLYDEKRNWTVGTTNKNFATREEAEQAIVGAKESSRVLSERTSLEKTFANDFFRISETSDGHFRITLPGLMDSSTGYFVGTSSRDFETWDEAKDYFLQSRENQERLTLNPLLEIQMNESERIAFSEFDAFNPKVAPSEQPSEVPASVYEYLMDKGRFDGSDASASTYQKTIEETGWDEQLFSFVEKYLNAEGQGLAQELNIEHLDALTPRQAVDLVTKIVIDLTKYKWSDKENDQKDLSPYSRKTTADQSSVLEILQEGQKQKDDPNWEGNGICRNFASSVKAVFEAVKLHQTKFSQLHDTYCLYESGMNEFAPKREDGKVTKIGASGHAWNTFLTLSKAGDANATITDVTWAKRNLDTKEVEGLDHTLLRMEPVIYAVGVNLSKDAPNRVEQLNHLLSYYTLKIEGVDQKTVLPPSASSLNEQEKTRLKDMAIKSYADYDLTGFEDDQLIKLGLKLVTQVRKNNEQKQEKEFLVTRAMELMRRQGVPQEIHPALVSAIVEVYSNSVENIDQSEVETIYQIHLNNPSLNFDQIFEKYLKKIPLSNYHASSLVFSNDDLQLKVYEQINKHPDFKNLLKESQRFRIRMREIAPELFEDFSPVTISDDAEELKYLTKKSQYLRNRMSSILMQEMTEERIGTLIERARNELREKNQERYESEIAGISDYEVIKQFDKLFNEMG